MGAGGIIIIDDAQDLLAAVLKPHRYGQLSKSDEEKVEVINVKPELERSQEDVNFLLDKLNEVCRR